MIEKHLVAPLSLKAYFYRTGIAGIKSENSNRQPTKSEDMSNTNNNQSEGEVFEIDDDDSDADVQIVAVEPVVQQIDDVSQELDRLR